MSEKTSPAWQYTLLDATFDGQRIAAIREHEAGLTLANVSIKNTPVGIEIDRGYGDWLWGSQVRFENVAKAALVISNEDSVYTQVGFQDAVASRVPTFARFRDSGKTVPGPGAHYQVSDFHYGLVLPGFASSGKFGTGMQAAALAQLPPPAPQLMRTLPPTAQWANARRFGARGDGHTDDTAALQKAVDSSRVVYLPLGFYIINDTIRLKPDTVILGLHPGLTQLVLPNGSAKYAGIGTPKAMLESAKGGDAIVSGIGLASGEVNPRAVALLWKAGVQSLVDDVRIQGGHGTVLYAGSRKDPDRKTADFDPTAHWDRQYPSVWVTDGGGGSFVGVWSPSTFAQAGFYVSHTRTPGKVYQLSAEHHLRAEIVLDHVENWEFFAPQTEQEVRDGMDAVSLEVRNARNILFANYHGYRVTRSIKPAATAVKLHNATDIRFRNVHVNGESGFAGCDEQGCGTYLRASKFPFENAIEDVSNKTFVREREFALLDIGKRPVIGTPSPLQAQKLEDGFFSIGGGVADASGKLYFVERKFNRIYSWTEERGLEVVRDAPLDPVNLALDASGALLVQSSFGPKTSVYSFKPDAPSGQLTVIQPTPVRARPQARTVLPVNWWVNGEFRDQLDPATYEFNTLAELFAREVGKNKTHEYVSPDGSLVLPAFRIWRQGPTDHLGWRWTDTVQTYGFVSARVGERVVFTNASENRTYSGVVGQGGTLGGLQLVAPRGGESAVLGPDGLTYVANGQVFVYAADGKEVARIDVPERPLQLVFGGEKGRTLFILSHRALYGVER